MEYIIITNNRKVANLYHDTNKVKFYENKNFLHILDRVQEKVYEGHRLLSDPIIAHIEDSNNPFKSVLISKENFQENDKFKKIIDVSVKIAMQLERCPKDLTEDEIESFRFIDLKLLQEAILPIEEAASV